MADNINSSIDERRDYRDRPQSFPSPTDQMRQATDVTAALITTVQPALHIMATLFNAYGHSLRAMSEAFEDERRRAWQQQSQREDQQRHDSQYSARRNLG